MLFAVLAFSAVVLTYAMFQSKNSMLGFPSAMMWAILGGYCYIESEATWDIYFIFSFACLLGMTTFCALGAYGLREKRDTLGDESVSGSTEPYIDEEPDPQEKNWYEDDGIPDSGSGKSVSQSRKERLVKRRSNTGRRGEFGF